MVVELRVTVFLSFKFFYNEGGYINFIVISCG